MDLVLKTESYSEYQIICDTFGIRKWKIDEEVVCIYGWNRIKNKILEMMEK